MADHTIRLGLMGERIGRSLAPRLHEHLGRLHGLSVHYDLFDGHGVAGYDPYRVCRERAELGYAGLNVTQPFKRVMRAHVAVPDARVARIGSINTIRLQGEQWSGTNTDFTGFLRAYRGQFGSAAPGDVVMAGAGGVGRAIAFAMAQLGAHRLSIADVDASAAQALAESVARVSSSAVTAIDLAEMPELAAAANGLVNCTPVGMHYIGGSPFPEVPLGRQRWAFDAVYTPLWTPFLQAARDAGLAVLTGYELFLFQGQDAFREFTGRDTAAEDVRAAAEGWIAEREAKP